MKENNTESVYTVSAKTARYMDMLSKLTAAQSEVIDFLMEEGLNDDAIDAVAQPVGEAAKEMQKLLNERINERLIEGCTEI